MTWKYVVKIARLYVSIVKMPLQSRVRLENQTAVMCVCFQRRRVCYNANYVPDK